jgi:hypothetical protein
LTGSSFLLALADGLGATAVTGDSRLKIELDEQERRALGRALVDRKARLIERAGDTTHSRETRRAGLLESSAIASVLRKLRRLTRRREGAAKAKFLAPAALPLLTTRGSARRGGGAANRRVD